MKIIATIFILCGISYAQHIVAHNVDNIRIVGQGAFKASAAGINAADADLGANNNGEIWIPPGATVNAVDAQISIGGSHTLRVMGTLNIDAVNKGAILVGKYTHITCTNTSNGNGGASGVGQIVNTGSGTMPGGMVQTSPQDGSLETFYVDACDFYGGSAGVTTGMIDISGMNDKGWVRDNLIYGYTSGWGIYDTDIQSGIKAGTSNIEISGNWIVPSGSGSGGCLEVIHSATNAVILQQMHIRNNECQLTLTSTIATAPIIFQNTSAGGGNLRTMDNSFWLIQGVPAGQPSITINGLQSSNFANISCGGNSTTCISITNNAVNASIHFKNINLFTGTNVIVDNNNSITLTAPSQDYEFFLSTAPVNTLGRIVVPYTFDRPIVSATGTGLQLTEGSSPTGIGTVDQLWGDSANHAVGFILSANAGPEIAANNNGGWTIGSIAGQNRIDSSGTTGFPFRTLNSGNAFTGLETTTFQAVGTQPTLTGTGACATSSTQVGGLGAGNFTCTGTTGASTVTLTFGSTAAHWYSCFGSDTTHTLAGSQSGVASTTACTLTFTSVTANDIITFGAIAF